MEVPSLMMPGRCGRIERVQAMMRLAMVWGACCATLCEATAAEPRVLLEVGRDYPETRLFSGCLLNGRADALPRMAVAGFSQTGHGDVADLAVYEVTDTAAVLQARIMRRGGQKSSIRTLRAADLDGDGHDELIALGRAGDEEVDSTGELQVNSFMDDLLQVLATASWQSGRYTHGYGMDLADLDGDDRPEIITGGFFRGDSREQAELRVWRLDGSRLKLLTSQSWGSETGDTRLNAVCAGDVTGDGRIDIVAAGRTGQVRRPDDTNQAEADQITVWSFRDQQLHRVASYEGDPNRRSRFREVRLADIDGRTGLEILAVGRTEYAARGSGRGAGGGGGRGLGGAGGRGTGSGGVTSAPIRPLLQVFTLEGEQLRVIAEGTWGDAWGEVRDVAVFGADENLRIVTAMADDLKPDREARIDVWQATSPALTLLTHRSANLGDETRARQVIVAARSTAPRILTIGFVKRGDTVLGQILDWGAGADSVSAAASRP
ncbi:MAG: FG-GAP repeat domain-containing protein [Planctomycetaceae bacterium]